MARFFSQDQTGQAGASGKSLTAILEEEQCIMAFFDSFLFFLDGNILFRLFWSILLGSMCKALSHGRANSYPWGNKTKV